MKKKQVRRKNAKLVCSLTGLCASLALLSSGLTLPLYAQESTRSNEQTSEQQAFTHTFTHHTLISDIVIPNVDGCSLMPQIIDTGKPPYLIVRVWTDTQGVPGR